MKHYIREKNTKLDELAYYGPFEEFEIEERLNDAFADYMAEGGANIDGVLLSFSEACNMYINPREFWMSQLATLTDIQEITSA